ncbi:MAG: hypothetical protein GEV12_23930 [Micromonosporaceae bacterium]|nr:hypothetical protein [Micromonosporaceae bacterium]
MTKEARGGRRAGPPVLVWEPTMVWQCDGCGLRVAERAVQEWEDQDWLSELIDRDNRTWCQPYKLGVFGRGPVC